jgi:hypothetical protein
VEENPVEEKLEEDALPGHRTKPILKPVNYISRLHPHHINPLAKRLIERKPKDRTEPRRTRRAENAIIKYLSQYIPFKICPIPLTFI